MLILAIALLAAGGAFEKYQADNETTCAARADAALPAPESWSASGHRFTVSGARAEVRAEGKREGVKLGLLAAIKDFSPSTKANLEAFVAAFQKAGVRGIVVAGDSAYGAEEQEKSITDLFTWLGGQGLPVYVVIGNSESGAAFNRGLLAAWKANHSVLNLDLVRRVDGDGFTLVSQPGYYDRRFITESSGCQYKPDDLAQLKELASGAPGPVVLVTHGPPLQSGPGGLDVTKDGRNVGDPALGQAALAAQIGFGVVGHILEAGGRATDLAGTGPVRQGRPAAALFVNPGPAFADPWEMNGGKIARGMAAILTLRGGPKGDRAEWQQVLAAPLLSASGKE